MFGVSESCYRHFGIPAKLASDVNVNFGDDFTIDKIFPDILAENLEIMKSSGVELKIDTTLIPKEFPIEHNNSFSSENNE